VERTIHSCNYRFIHSQLEDIFVKSVSEDRFIHSQLEDIFIYSVFEDRFIYSQLEDIFVKL